MMYYWDSFIEEMGDVIAGLPIRRVLEMYHEWLNKELIDLIRADRNQLREQLAAAQEREHAARGIAGMAQQEVDDLERRILRWRVQPWWKRVYTAVFPHGRLP